MIALEYRFWILSDVTVGFFVHCWGQIHLLQLCTYEMLVMIVIVNSTPKEVKLSV